MTQALQIIRDALGHLGVQDANAAVKPIDARDCLHALNLMMRGWEAEGMALGWQDIAEATADMPTPPEADEAIGYNLAVRLRARYRVSIDPDIVALAIDGRAMLSARQQATSYERTEYPDLPVGVRGWGSSWRDGFYG